MTDLVLLSAAQADLSDLERGLLGLPQQPPLPVLCRTLAAHGVLLHALGPLFRFGDQGQLLLLPAAGVASLPAEDAVQLAWAHPWPGQISLCPPCSRPPSGHPHLPAPHRRSQVAQTAHRAYASQVLLPGSGQVQQQLQALVVTLGAGPCERLAVNGNPGTNIHGPASSAAGCWAVIL